MTFVIGGRAVGLELPPFVIAEAGVNHNGRTDLAIELVDAAADAGADAVKFQTFTARALATVAAPQAAYQQVGARSNSQLEMLASLELEPAGLAAAFAHARKRRITAFSTPFDDVSVDLLVKMGVPCFKIGSGDITNLPLLRKVASQEKPIILSTGMSTLEEVDAAISAIGASGGPPLAILHCVSAYPTPIEELNLLAIPALRRRYEIEVGFSDHSIGSTAATVAVALGATVVEKHLTLDRTLPGPDHAASMEPGDFAGLVQRVRETHATLGDGIKRPQPSETDTRLTARRSIVLARDLPAGAVLGHRDLAAKRPATGITPMRLDSVVGRRLVRAMSADEILAPGDFEPTLEPA